jgi:hypothetical protein
MKTILRERELVADDCWGVRSKLLKNDLCYRWTTRGGHDHLSQQALRSQIGPDLTKKGTNGLGRSLEDALCREFLLIIGI